MIFSCTLLFKNDLQIFIADVEVAIASLLIFILKEKDYKKSLTFHCLSIILFNTCGFLTMTTSYFVKLLNVFSRLLCFYISL